MQRLIYIVLFILIISCKQDTIQNDYLIYNTVIKEMSKFPKVFSNGNTIGVNIDSLNHERNKNIKVCININLFETEKSKKKLFPKEFLFFFEDDVIPSKDDSFDESKLNKFNDRKIKLITGKPDFSIVDIYLNYSKIIYNEERNKAVLEAGRSYNKLSGGGAFYLLKKIDNSWKIIKVISTWVS